MKVAELGDLIADAELEHGTINGFRTCGENGDLVKAVILAFAPGTAIGECRACLAQQKLEELNPPRAVIKWLRSVAGMPEHSNGGTGP